ncbi:MAG TPA: hypothetical protein DEG43_04780 [Acidimicrobiaceae bacterium]|nr:hypothetical protein [Acidimicrobiaceae bacterium]
MSGGLIGLLPGCEEPAPPPPPPTSAAIRFEIVRTVSGELGVAENPAASNVVPGKPYNINDQWCAAFATWAWGAAGIPVRSVNNNYVPALVDWAKAQNRWRGPSSLPSPGDMNIEGDSGGAQHVNIVTAINQAANSYEVIGGNQNIKGSNPVNQGVTPRWIGPDRIPFEGRHVMGFISVDQGGPTSSPPPAPADVKPASPTAMSFLASAGGPTLQVAATSPNLGTLGPSVLKTLQQPDGFLDVGISELASIRIGNTPHVFGATRDGFIFHAAYGLGAWLSEPKIYAPDFDGRRIAAVTTGGANITLYYSTLSGGIRSIVNNGPGWFDAGVVATNLPANGRFAAVAAPAPGSSAGQLHVFYTNNEYGISHVWQDFAGGTRQSERLVGNNGVAPDSEIAAQVVGLQVQFYYVQPDRGIGEGWWDVDRWRTATLPTPDFGVGGAGALSVSAYGDQHHVFYSGPNGELGHLWHWFDINHVGRWSSERLGSDAVATTPQSIRSMAFGLTQLVVMVGQDQVARMIYWNGSAWTPVSSFRAEVELGGSVALVGAG